MPTVCHPQKRSHGWCLVVALVALATLGFQQAVPEEGLTPQEKRGKAIYQSGLSPSGAPLTAMLGSPGVAIPASMLPCIGCHGADGKGKPEGGVTPSDLTWEALTKPYATTLESGRTRPPYSEPGLKRAITMGFDAASNPLDTAMPRYQLSQEDAVDLIAYLKKIGKERDPGLTETGLRIGVLLPPAGLLNDQQQVIRAMLTAYVDQLNEQGGVYGRRIELRFITLPPAPADRAAATRAFIEQEAIFALVASFIAGADADIAAVVAEAQIPLVGALTFDPQVGFPLNRYVFYLFSGLRSQGRVLTTYAATRLAHPLPPAALVFPAEPMLETTAEAMAQQGEDLGWPAFTRAVVEPRPDAAIRLALALQTVGTEVVFFLGNGADALTLLKAAAALGWHPTVFAPGLLVGEALFAAPAAFQDRLFLSFPTLPSDQSSDGAQEYRKLADAYRLPQHHFATQRSAFSSAKILVEGLQQSGKAVSREKLLTALEGLYKFQTGFAPPITYTPNQRIGAYGAYIVAVDLERQRLVPVSAWIEP